MNLITRHLTGLVDFSGRERRQPFWLWVLIVMATAMIAWMAVFMPMFAGTFGKIEQFARDHPDQVTRTVGPGSYSIQVNGYHPELMPDFGALLPVLSFITAVIIALLAAAVARRLHDSGRSAWWGVMPIPFLVCGLVAMNMVFSAFGKMSAPGAEPDPAFFAYFGLLFLNNLFYLGTLGLLVFFCARKGDLGDNRFGPAND